MKGQFDLPEHMETIMDILEAVRTETERRLLEGFYNEDIFEVLKNEKTDGSKNWRARL